jgi:hypothetical protein
MTRRSLRSTGLFASVVVVLVTVLAGCTDPNTMRTNNNGQSQDPPERESHLSR